VVDVGGGPLRLGLEQGEQALLDRGLHRLGGRRRPPHEGRDPVADAPDLGLDAAEEVAGPDELLPPGEHLAPQQRTVGGGGLQPAERLGLGRGDAGAQLVDRRHLLLGGNPEGGGLSEDGGHRAEQGLARHARAGGGVGGQRAQPLPDGGDLVLGQVVAVEDGLLDREEGCLGESPVDKAPPEVGAHLADHFRRHPVQDDRHHGVAGRGVAQQVPRDGVGVARGGGDEQPQVRGGQQLGRDLPVLVDHRVDVGGVDDRETLGQAAGGADLQLRVNGGVGGRRRGRGVGGDAHPGEGRQDAVVLEPGGLRGVVQEQGPAGGGPDRGGGRDVDPEQGVHQGGLAGAGGPPDDREERRVQALVTGQHVVVELVHQVLPRLARLHRPVDREGEGDGGEEVPQRAEPHHRTVGRAGHVRLPVSSRRPRGAATSRSGEAPTPPGRRPPGRRTGCP